MAKTHQRVFALVAALLFLGTSIAFSLFVIFQTRSQNDSSTDDTSIKTTSEGGTEGMLQGTKLEGFEPVESVSELQIIDIKEGDGEVVPEGATVTAHYTGALAKDGTIFQSSHDTGEAVTFPLSQVIEGWQKGVPGMKVGGTRRLLIPAAMAYGDQATDGIPANSDLVFDIEMVKLGE
jgi:FKBP-type peptidyl-prolyl cis-trans isomerase